MVFDIDKKPRKALIKENTVYLGSKLNFTKRKKQ